MENQKNDALALPNQSQQSAEIIRTSGARQTRLAAFTPVNLTEAIALAKMMAASGMVPQCYQKKPADILVAIQFGSEVGLAPMQSLQSVSVINGRPSLWGDAALALVQGHPDFEDIIESGEDQKSARCVVKRKGRTPVDRKFTVEDAARAGLLSKGPWVQYRNRMLQMRARGFALRDSFADVLKGISIAEESMDLPTDTSPAKQQREAMTFDVTNLSSSPEPNRGHEDTGLEKNGKFLENKVEQKPAKEEPTMCSECREIGKHKPDCKFAAKAEQDAKTSKPTAKNAYLVTGAAAKKSKKQGDYMTLAVKTNAGDGLLYIWHKSIASIFAGQDTRNRLRLLRRFQSKRLRMVRRSIKSSMFWNLEAFSMSTTSQRSRA